MWNLEKIIAKFKKSPNTETFEVVSEGQKDDPIMTVKNWYEEKYDSAIVQRNVLGVFALIMLILSVVCTLAIGIVVNSKRFDPFVIQIDDSTGVAQVVNPLSSNILDANEELAKYFIKRYVTARETYNPVDFDTMARQTIRLLSTSGLYWGYMGYIKRPEIDPTIRYGQKNTTYLIAKSWSKLADKKFLFRFVIKESAGNQSEFNKLAVVDYDYVPMELTEADREINPIGFQIKGYRVDDDNS